MSDIGPTLKGFFEKAVAVIGGVGQAVNQLIEEAHQQGYEVGREHGYQQGYQAGRAAMRDAILRAAEAPAIPTPDLVLSDGSNVVMVEAKSRTTTSRAPRGSVGQFVASQLKGNRGMTLLELQAAAEAAHEDIAPTSISNELHRNRATKYRRGDDGRWRLLEASAADATKASAAQEVYQPAA